MLWNYPNELLGMFFRRQGSGKWRICILSSTLIRTWTELVFPFSTLQKKTALFRCTRFLLFDQNRPYSWVLDCSTYCLLIKPWNWPGPRSNAPMQYGSTGAKTTMSSVVRCLNSAICLFLSPHAPRRKRLDEQCISRFSVARLWLRVNCSWLPTTRSRCDSQTN